MVHDALEIICSVPSIIESLIPKTTVLMPSLLGTADSITFFAPAIKCCEANFLVKNNPVDSITISISKKN